MAWLGGRSSFYVDCDAFNTSATAPRRGTEMFLEEEGQRIRLSLLRELDNSPDKVGAGEPYQWLRMVDIDHAARWCANDPQCTGVCFSSETGWARYYHHQIQQYEVDTSGTKGWVCLSLKGIGPMGTGMKSEMRPCFHGLEEASDGAWQPTKVPKDELWLPDGTVVPMRLYPNSQNLVHQAQMRAQVPALFATVCEDQSASSRRPPCELGAFL
ncbi:unnamed protein product [Symbiodinium microadriaticum]|nr:unnamed protein product [Symbiodinium microadriaticum]